MNKKSFKFQYVFIVIFALLFFGLVSIGAYSVINLTGINSDSADESLSNNADVDINWKELYPFNEEITAPKKSDVQNASMLSTISKKYKNIIASVSDYAGNNTDFFVGVDAIKRVGVNASKIIYKSSRFSQGEYQQIDNGQIIAIETQNDSYGKEAVNGAKSFFMFLKEKDVPLLYVQPLTKYDETEEYKSYVNENRDVLVSELKESGVDVLDLRKQAATDKISVDEAFYKTDHHWKTSIGLWATRNIAKHIEDDYSIDFNDELLDEKNYELRIFENAMFGSYGQSAGLCWCDYENHPVFYPDFKTSFNIEIPNKSINNSGDFNVLFNNEKLNEFAGGKGNYVYETACYGNTPLTKIKNNNLPDAPRVLVIRDSFGLAVLPYLSCVCSELDSIDIRPQNGNFNGSVKTYVEQFNPDIVIILYGSASKDSFCIN